MRKKFRQLIANNKWLKAVPTSLTICNSLCGFAAIIHTLNAYENPKSSAPVFAISCWFILSALIFDALDGFTARIFNAASMHGLNMDSLADMVTFGLAPAVVVAIMAHSLRELSKMGYYFVWAMCAVYIACAAYRLAKYNVHAIIEKKKSELFSGLPTPGAASGICSLVIYYSLENCKFQQIIVVIPPYAGILGLLMVSNIPYIHVGKWLQSAKKSPARILAILLVLTAIILKPSISMIILINLYILSGPVGYIFGYFFNFRKNLPVVEPQESTQGTKIK